MDFGSIFNSAARCQKGFTARMSPSYKKQPQQPKTPQQPNVMFCCQLGGLRGHTLLLWDSHKGCPGAPGDLRSHSCLAQRCKDVL